MNKFLNYSGLIAFIDKCKSYFQKKDIVINISRDDDGNWEISSNPFNDIKNNINSANIVVNVVDNNGYKYKATNVSCVYVSDNNYYVNFDVLTYLADDAIQYIYHFRLDVADTAVDIYFTEQEHIYNSDFIMTGTGMMEKKEIGFSKIYKVHPDNLEESQIDKIFECLDNGELVACSVDGLIYPFNLVDDTLAETYVLTRDGNIETISIDRNYQTSACITYVVNTQYKNLELSTTGDGTKVLADNGNYVELPSSSDSSYFTIDASNLDLITDDKDKIAELWNIIQTGEKPIFMKNINVKNMYTCHTFVTVLRSTDAMDAELSVTLTPSDKTTVSGVLLFDATIGFEVSDFGITQ